MSLVNRCCFCLQEAQEVAHKGEHVALLVRFELLILGKSAGHLLRNGLHARGLERRTTHWELVAHRAQDLQHLALAQLGHLFP